MSLGPWDNNVAACLVGSGGGKKFSSHLALSTNNNRQSPQKEQKMINCTFNARLLLQTMFLSRQRNLCSLWTSTSTSISYREPSQGKTPLLPYIIYHAVNRGVSPMWKQLKHFPDVCAELCWGEVVTFDLERRRRGTRWWSSLRIFISLWIQYNNDNLLIPDIFILILLYSWTELEFVVDFGGWK